MSSDRVNPDIPESDADNPPWSGKLFGIVIAKGPDRSDDPARAPRISAFIWGGKTRPVPTLPFGRWRGAA